MTTAAAAHAPEQESPAPITDPPRRERLWLKVLLLALPVVTEQMLHSVVGTTDTWLANHLLDPAHDPNAAQVNRAASAAVGSVQYVLWLMGLVAGAIGTGATALIARAVGARDRRTANASCGQAVTLALISGAILGLLMLLAGPWFASATRLEADAQAFFTSYVRLLAFAMPLTLLMFAAGAALRGAGDTITPAIAMIVVDLVNVFCTVGFTYGKFGLPRLGFDGIAIGTTVAYAAGGILLLVVLFRRKGFMRLYVHRLRPHWAPLQRILRIGLPSGAESMLQWVANFAVLGAINSLGNAAATAHMNAIRLESFSFLTGLGFATAAATLVGQSLGMGDPQRARRCSYLAFAMGGGFMTFVGALFVAFGGVLASQLSDDPEIVRLTANCIRTTGFIQAGFGASMIFGSAMRGAGDTMAVMLINLLSIFVIRFTGVLIVVQVLNLGLQAVWYCLCADLFMRGLLMFLRFRFGRWETTKV